MTLDAIPSPITYHAALEQGSDEWLEARRGILTASEMKHVLTPTLKVANNEKTRAHLYELLAQRISGFVEPHYVSDDMLRGQEDEFYARQKYAEKIAPVEEVGFITNNRWGFTIGYSPDGLVGKTGLLEIKSRRQKFQVQTIIENVAGETVPTDFLMQVQTGLAVSEREWLDFISYSGGLPMAVIRIWPDAALHSAIIEAASEFEDRLRTLQREYEATLASGARLFPTERTIYEDMTL